MGTKEILKEELKVSVAKFKEMGFEISEEMAMKLMVEVSDMLGRIAVRTENKIDDFYLIVKGKFEGLLTEMIDKIDGKKNRK